MDIDPFIDTAILAQQTIDNAARLRDSALDALTRKAQWQISQIIEPDFSLTIDIDHETAGVPLLNIFIPLDLSGTPAVRVQLPADKADVYLIYDLVKHVCLDGPVEPVHSSDTNPSDDILVYDNITGELKGRIELR